MYRFECLFIDKDGVRIDRIFGECTVLGRVPVEAGEGYLAALHWAKDGGAKPKARRAEAT